MQAMGNVLLSNRLVAFALVPVCARIGCANAAAGIASFVQAGVAGNRGADSEADLRSPDWSRHHARQLALVTALESRLIEAVGITGLEDRIAALVGTLEAAGAAGVSSEATAAGATRLSSSVDPLPALLDPLLGRSDDAALTDLSVRVLAAFMAVYDAGGMIRRARGKGLMLDVSTSTSPAKATTPGGEAAKWLVDDDMLISAALGLL
jgi:hypothetical protein